MARVGIRRALRVLSPAVVTGPILSKELRISARRRRSFLLRFGYVALLAAFVALVWLARIHWERLSGYRSDAFRVSRMAEAGKLIITTIVWFQFCTTQVIAIVLLSTAVSEEVTHRTLGVLMSTPITSVQVVAGKLLSGLWQLLVLMAASVPLLLLVRVLGGVPWDYVAAALAITAASVVFLGSVSMLMSVVSRRTHLAILRTFIVVGLAYGLLPALGYAMVGRTAPALRDRAAAALVYANPVAMLVVQTQRMLNPAAPGAGSVSWPHHCAGMLAASVAVLAACVVGVRRVALRQAAGEVAPALRRRRRGAAGRGRSAAQSPGKVRRVVGPPILWKELRAPVIRGRLRRLIVLGVLLAVLAGTYALCVGAESVGERDTHVTYVLMFLGLGALGTSVMASIAITSERESRCWPLLMVTTLGGSSILLGKAVGAAKRSFPFWLLLVGHLGLFAALGVIRPIALLHLGILAVTLVAFLTGTGLYFSARFRRTTLAAVTNLALAAALWVVLPVLLVMLLRVVGSGRGLTDAVLWFNPVAQATAVTSPAVGVQAADPPPPLRYQMLGGSVSPATATWLLLVSLGGYGLAGLLFAWRAEHWFRKKVF